MRLATIAVVGAITLSGCATSSSDEGSAVPAQAVHPTVVREPGDNPFRSGGSINASCVAPHLNGVPPDAQTVSAAKPVSPGDSLTIYGHWYTTTCNDTGGHDPLKPLPPVHLTLVWPSGAVQHLGEFTPAGHEMGFSVVVHVPDGTPAGIAKVSDDQEYPSTYTFDVAG